MNLRSICLAALAVSASGVWAQGQDYQAMVQGMEKAQAEAARPGDDKLTCEQLETEVVTAAQDPQLQAHIEAAGEDAQKQQEAMKVAKSQIAMQAIRTAMMSTVQGAALPGMASMQAEATAKGMKGMKQTLTRMEQAKQMMTLMPTLFRAQHLIELAAGKGCEWAKSATGTEE